MTGTASLDSIIASSRRERSKTKGKTAKTSTADSDFDMDFDGDSDSAEGKKARRSKRRASKANGAEKTAKAAKATRATAKAEKAAKPARSSRTERKAAAKEEAPAKSARASKRATAKASKTEKSAKPARAARGERSAKPAAAGAVAYKGELGKLLAGAKLERPGKFYGTDANSVNNHFIAAVHKNAAKTYTVGNISKAIVFAVSEGFGAKVPPSEAAAFAGKVRDKLYVNLARDAKRALGKLKADVKKGGVELDTVQDAADALFGGDE